MADETYTPGTAVPAAHDREPLGEASPAATRAEIEMTRARMSDTIDEIEDALLRKKERIQSRMDVTAPVRENPVPAAAAALGAGLLLGLLTGGPDDDEKQLREYDDRLRLAEQRADTWEARARRLMRVAQKQEARLEAMEYADDWEMEDERPILERISDGASGLFGGVVRDMFAGRR